MPFRTRSPTPQVFSEKLQAIGTPLSEWISSLEVKHISSADGLAGLLNWSTKRNASFQALAQLVYCCEHLPAHSDPSTKKLGVWLRNERPPDHAFTTQIEEVLHSFWCIASDSVLNRPFSMNRFKVSPVEFCFIGTMTRVSVVVLVQPC